MLKNRQVVFNVGGALSVYTETDNKIVINDLGKSDSFNPVIDFMLPLFKKRNSKKEDNKYKVDQLIISHLHKDHISAITDFYQYFSPDLLTCPNDKHNQPTDEILNWELLNIDTDDESVKTIKEMWENRRPPLTTSINIGANAEQNIFWIPPKIVESTNALRNESYANNTSLLSVYRINGHTVLLPGDLQKEGIKHLLENDYHDYENHRSAARETLKNILTKHRVCVLVAPHHGLESAFSVDLFQIMYSGKTRCLNIISEKINNPDENRNVDSRYSSQIYCDGDNNLLSTNNSPNNYQRKTSGGHICIDYSDGFRPKFTIIQETDELMNWFFD